MKAWWQRITRGGVRYVPPESWIIFHPNFTRQSNDSVRFRVTHSPHLRFVHAQVHPSPFQINLMRYGTALIVSSAIYQFVTNLHRVPITGRTQVAVLSPSEECDLGSASAMEEIKKSQLITTGPHYRMCVDVAARLVSVAEHLIPRNYTWQIWLVNAPDKANACCYPGGKMIVYSGIFQVIEAAVAKGILKNKHDALAVILSHEMAHALARHTAERMSYLPLFYLQVILGRESPLLQYLFELTMNLPFSRKQEMEADHIGIMLMASACYEPEAAPSFWKAFRAELRSSQEAEEDLNIDDFDFYSTHPSHKKREKMLEGLVDQARARQLATSWCYQVKERVQAIMDGAPVENIFLQRIKQFRRQQVVRRNSSGSVHKMENMEIYKGIEQEQKFNQIE